MSEASSMFGPMTSEDTPSVTSSLGLEDGVTLSVLQDGPTMGQCGPEAARVSPSRLQDEAMGIPTSVTCGQNSADLSQSQSLQSALESKLRARLGKAGLWTCDLIWDYWDLGSGPPVCALIPLVRHTKGSARFGLPTPQAMDAKGYSEALRHKYRRTGHLKHWTHGTALAIHSSTGVSSWPKPELTEWMMGFPPSWTFARRCVPTVTPSSRKSRQSL